MWNNEMSHFNIIDQMVDTTTHPSYYSLMTNQTLLTIDKNLKMYKLKCVGCIYIFWETYSTVNLNAHWIGTEEIRVPWAKCTYRMIVSLISTANCFSPLCTFRFQSNFATFFSILTRAWVVVRRIAKQSYYVNSCLTFEIWTFSLISSINRSSVPVFQS